MIINTAPTSAHHPIAALQWTYGAVLSSTLGWFIPCARLIVKNLIFWRPAYISLGSQVMALRQPKPLILIKAPCTLMYTLKILYLFILVTMATQGQSVTPPTAADAPSPTIANATDPGLSHLVSSTLPTTMPVTGASSEDATSISTSENLALATITVDVPYVSRHKTVLDEAMGFTQLCLGASTSPTMQIREILTGFPFPVVVSLLVSTTLIIYNLINAVRAERRLRATGPSRAFRMS